MDQHIPPRVIGAFFLYQKDLPILLKDASHSVDNSEQEGLVVIYDEDTETITFDWNQETHPEYNFLSLMTPEELSKMLMDYLHTLEDEHEEPTVQGG